MDALTWGCIKPIIQDGIKRNVSLYDIKLKIATLVQHGSSQLTLIDKLVTTEFFNLYTEKWLLAVTDILQKISDREYQVKQFTIFHPLCKLENVPFPFSEHESYRQIIAEQNNLDPDLEKEIFSKFLHTFEANFSATAGNMMGQYETTESVNKMVDTVMTIGFIDARVVLIIRGLTLTVSKCLMDAEKIINRHRLCGTFVQEIHFIVSGIFEIDCDISGKEFRGISVLIVADTIHVSTPCLWKISGKNVKVRKGIIENQATTEPEVPVSSSGKYSPNGKNGKNGEHGQNGGCVTFISRRNDNLQNLVIETYGGNAGDSEDGENGRNGEDGMPGNTIELEKIKQDFPSPAVADRDVANTNLTIIRRRLRKDLVDYQEPVCCKNSCQPLTSFSTCNHYVCGLTKEGNWVQFSFYKSLIHCSSYLLIEGGPGKNGEDDGLPGNGGHPGLGGKPGGVRLFSIIGCQIESAKEDSYPSILANNGKNGNPGNPGKKPGIQGMPGKKGYDTGYFDSMIWLKPLYFKGNFKVRSWGYVDSMIWLKPVLRPLDYLIDVDVIKAWCCKRDEYVRLDSKRHPDVDVAEEWLKKMEVGVYVKEVFKRLDDKKQENPLTPTPLLRPMSIDQICFWYLPLFIKSTQNPKSITRNPVLHAATDSVPSHSSTRAIPTRVHGIAYHDFIHDQMAPTSLPLIEEQELKNIYIKTTIQFSSKLYSSDINISLELAMDLYKELHTHKRISKLKEMEIIIISHGFMSSSKVKWMQKMRKKIVKFHPHFVVGLLDWSTGCNSTFKYPKAAACCRQVGLSLGATLDQIHSEFEKNGVKLSIWGIGHSLGAHLMGAAGYYCVLNNKPKFTRITGLDPAGVGFENFPTEMLSGSNAIFVDIIHTDGYEKNFAEKQAPRKEDNFGTFDDQGVMGNYGTMGAIGHADFYPNAGFRQPIKDEWSFTGTGSHSHATTLFIHSIKAKGKFRTVLRYKGAPQCGNPPPTIILAQGPEVEMGFYCNPHTRGCYYLETTDCPPFMNDVMLQKNVEMVGVTVDDGDDVLRKQIPGWYMQSSDNERYALIINIQTYQKNTHGERHGSHHDANALRGLLLQQLKYKYRVFTTKSNSDKKKVITELDNFFYEINKEPKKIDTIIVAVMGHGGGNDTLIASDGAEILIHKEIIERFGNRKCPKLVGVPQIFLVQTCRGDRIDPVSGPGKKVLAAATGEGAVRSTPELPKRPLEDSLPNMSDTLLAFSTNRDSKSVRYDTGAWFIQFFVDSVLSTSPNKPTDVLTLLNGIMEHAKGFEHNLQDPTNSQGTEERIVVKQIPVVENVGFTKKFFL